MSNALLIRNRQRCRRLNLPYLRRSLVHLVEQELEIASYDLAFYIVGSAAMARLNSEYLGHEGVTDVITFNYADTHSAPSVHGEIFICLQVAQSQAVLYRTSWEEELVRYMIHGVLHLVGFDDLEPQPKKKMKRAENTLLRRLTKLYPVTRVLVPGAGNLE